MHTDKDGNRVYSHTSLSLWRLCQRKWHGRYVLGTKEAYGRAAAFSTFLIHAPLSAHFGGLALDWKAQWQAFCEAIGGEDNVDDLHALGAARALVEQAIRNAPEGTWLCTEDACMLSFPGGARYYSRPDGIIEHGGRRYTVDWKYTEAKWRDAKTPWPVKELLPYDDQLLGQAICAQTDGFMRVTLRRNSGTGKVATPIIQSQLVDAALRTEWLGETEATILEIESWLKKTHASWPKNDEACFAYGRPCIFLRDCKLGFRRTY